MKNRCARLGLAGLAVWMAGVCMAWAAEPAVSNVRASQRVGTRLIDITYDVAHTSAWVKVTVAISTNGGVSFDVPGTVFSGAVGYVTTGLNRVAYWNAGADWAGKFSSQMQAKVTAVGGVLLPSGMVLVQGGTFMMESRETTVSSFSIGKYEVTWEEWLTVRSWAATNGYDISVGDGCATNHPSHSMMWYDMVKWCNARSQKEGLTPCYTVGGSVYKTGRSEPDCNWSSAGYRLPTEAEWQFAARGGNQSQGYEYSGSADVGAVAWYSANSSGAACNYRFGGIGTWPVGGKQSNELGLYDMSGNVWEWCWDWWYEAYGSGPVTDPRGPATGSSRVLRGGGWDIHALNCRVAHRCGYPFGGNNYVGFRVVLSPGQ